MLNRLRALVSAENTPQESVEGVSVRYSLEGISIYLFLASSSEERWRETRRMGSTDWVHFILNWLFSWYVISTLNGQAIWSWRILGLGNVWRYPYIGKRSFGGFFLYYRSDFFSAFKNGGGKNFDRFHFDAIDRSRSFSHSLFLCVFSHWYSAVLSGIIPRTIYQSWSDNSVSNVENVSR